jgi:hypothetical protein
VRVGFEDERSKKRCDEDDKQDDDRGDGDRVFHEAPRGAGRRWDFGFQILDFRLESNAFRGFLESRHDSVSRPIRAVQRERGRDLRCAFCLAHWFGGEMEVMLRVRPDRDANASVAASSRGSVVHRRAAPASLNFRSGNIC